MNETVDKPRTFALLRQKNIVKVEVSFSGGNDEGAADGYAAYLADGSTVELPQSAAYSQQEYNHQTRTYGPSKWVVWEHTPGEARSTQRDATPEEIEFAELTELLEAPVYAEYGSFAGDFYVSGTVTWDVAAGTVHMDRSEQTWQDASGVDF